MTWLAYRKEGRETQAEAIQAAMAAFLARTGQPATHIEAPAVWSPPLGCGLIWRGNAKWAGPDFRVGAEIRAQAARAL